MTILAVYIENKYRGKITVNDPINYKVLLKCPIPVLELEIPFGVESGQIQNNQQQNVNVGYNLDDLTSSLRYGLLPLAEHSGLLPSVNPRMLASTKFLFKLNPEDLAYIESQRIDDAVITVYVWGRLNPYKDNSSNPIESIETFSIAFQWLFSQAKWIKFLSDIGYSEKWIIEIDRPKLEGFREVTEHIAKAQEALYNKREPEDVIRDLRAARDSFKTYYEARKEKINELVDKGSLGQEGKDPKSRRIDGIYDSIATFLNIGPHNDKYKVTYADAQLAFREFVAMLSYLSPIITEAEMEGKKK